MLNEEKIQFREELNVSELKSLQVRNRECEWKSFFSEKEQLASRPSQSAL